jgi:hypothetical protein
MEIIIEKNRRLGTIVNFCFLFIVLILMFNKDNIKNVHVVFILVLLLLLILKNLLSRN